jgi:toxin CcdB
MAQWDVYPNPAERSRARLPYLVVVQSDLLAQLPTRLVVPLARSVVAVSALPQRLVPQFEVAGEGLVLKAHEVGSIESRVLRHPVANLRADSHRIVDALDAVVSGV